MGNVVARAGAWPSWRAIHHASTGRRAVDAVPSPIPKYKVLIVGGASVGKSTIFRCLLHVVTNGDMNAASPLAVGGATVNIGVKVVDMECYGPMVVELWDVPATHDKSSQKQLYFGDLDGVLFVHSAVNASSFIHVQLYHAMLMEPSQLSALPAMLVLQNKSDDSINAPAAVSQAQWLADHNLAQVNVSGKLNLGLLAALRRLLGDIAAAHSSTRTATNRPNDSIT